METVNNENLVSSVPESNGNHVSDITNVTGSITNIRQGRLKRGRKKKFGQSREDRKKLLNTNKTHFNSKGEVVEEKQFDENFECPCSKKCTSVVRLDLRKRLFKQFWSMGTYEGRCALLLSCVTDNPKKRTYTKTHMKNRTTTRKYTMFGHEVCKVAFIGTLQISQCRLDIALKKQTQSDTFGDCRGKSSGGLNAFSPAKREEVRTHIASFPTYNTKFLSAELNLAKMYELYKSTCENPVSKSYYKRVFYDDFNLRFKVQKNNTTVNVIS